MHIKIINFIREGNETIEVPFNSNIDVNDNVTQNDLQEVYENHPQFKDLTNEQRERIKETAYSAELDKGLDEGGNRSGEQGNSPSIEGSGRGNGKGRTPGLKNTEMETQTLYQKAIEFAAIKHQEKEQKVPGTDLPYIVHLSNVAMEIFIAASNTDNFDLNFAVQVALLHDTIEDTSTDFDELTNEFGIGIANGVSALTKNRDLPKEQQMLDSLTRIKKLPKEVRAVKLADRITNLQPPPKYWNKEKIQKYKNEATLICETLKGGNQYLENRLMMKIKEYETFIDL